MDSRPLASHQGVPHSITCRCGRRRGVLASRDSTWAILLCQDCDVTADLTGGPPRFGEVRGAE